MDTLYSYPAVAIALGIALVGLLVVLLLVTVLGWVLDACMGRGLDK